jgi:hypothetical protein
MSASLSNALANARHTVPMDERPPPAGIEQPPRMRPETIGAGAGMLWGAFCYSVLWEGTPFGVDLRFVESVGGTLLLLPARLVLWAVRAAEILTGRTFDLSSSTWILGVATAAVGLSTGVLVVLAVRGAASLLRR